MTPEEGRAVLAAKFSEIYGADEDSAFAELPVRVITFACRNRACVLCDDDRCRCDCHRPKNKPIIVIGP